jgi:hypothetical protein
LVDKITWTNCQYKLGDLRKWEGNPAEIGKAAAGRLLESFNEFGQAHVILIEPDLQILDGHQRDDVWGAKFGDDFVVDCRMASRKFTEAERRKFSVFLRSGTTGNYSWDILSSWDAPELIAWGLDNETARDWMRDASAINNLLGSEGIGIEYDNMPEYEQESIAGIIVSVHFQNNQDKLDFFNKLEMPGTEKTKSFWYPVRPEETKNQIVRPNES